jgi:GNAT superfamily N-acetyltransferase
MRADFIEPCLPYNSLRQLIQNNAEYLLTLGGLDLIEAITEPAKRQGYEITKDLLNQILEDIKQEPGFLPLLEFALTQLWERRDTEKHQLTLKAYEDIDGIKGALNCHANKVYDFKDYEKNEPKKKRSDQEKDVIKRIFFNLLRTSDGEKDTRWRKTKRQILSLAGDKLEEKVLEELIEGEQGLVKGRLLVTDSKQTEKDAWVDLAHEALIENWEKLAEWRKKSGDTRRLAERIDERWQQYKQKEEDYDYLLEGVLRQLAYDKQKELKEILRSEVWKFCEESSSVYSFYGAKIDYRNLAKLLKAQKWQEADNKTAELILIAVKGKYLDEKAMEILPCEDLQKINQLWMKYSDGKFGFSVQKEIYKRLGDTREYDEEVWTNFCDRVGWKKDGDWLYYDDLTFNLDAPKGHLPAAVRLDWEQGWWSHDFCYCLFSGSDLPMVELTNSPQDKELLRHFYRELYAHEFPDPNERESLENMERYLELKAQGWYKKNNYHIIISFQDGKPIAGAIADFLATANTGVLEFLVVAPEFREKGIGKALLKATENLLREDARQKLERELDCIVGEMNDPFQTTKAKNNLDPAGRALIWNKWGYGGLDFPYVQPALSDSQQPVCNLLLIAKIFREAWSRSIPSQTVKAIVHEYLRWAMRLETPDDCAEYREMAAFLDRRRGVPVLSLARYLGRDPLKSMDIRDVKSPDEADFAAVMSVYQRSFPASPLTIQPQEFGEALASVEKFKQSFHYHLWAIRTTPTAPVEGMASFFSFPGAGFGGYVTFEGSLSGTWRTRSLLARMEQQMLQDREPDDVGGWYIETDLAKKRSPFLRLGFWEVDIEYEQPPLSEQQVSLQIRLFYKPFGRVYGMPKVKCSDFLTAIAQIFRVVYRIDPPQQHPSYRKLAAQVDLFVDGWMRFCEK